MRLLSVLFALTLLLPASVAAAECIDFRQAPGRIGETICVTGKVVKVTQSQRSGTWFLNFCEDYRRCPFSAVVFAGDLRDVGDVRKLEGKDIELHGKIKTYDGKPEIVLKDIRQLRGDSAKIPPLPKEYDATRRGNFSAGRISSRGTNHSSR